MDKITAAKLEIEPITKMVGQHDQVLYDPEDGTGYQASVVEHVNKNDEYHLKGMYKGYTIQNPSFFKFVIQDDNKTRSVKFSHWRRLLTSNAKAGDLIEWKITSRPFNDGEYSALCSNCDGWFNGAKRQPLCEDCCDELAYASLHEHEKTKTRRPRLIKPDLAMTTAKKAFEMAQLGITWENAKRIIIKELKIK